MKTIRYFNYLLLVALLSSCYIAHKEQKRAFGCYKENYPCIDSLIETNGYYEISYYFPVEPSKRKTTPVKFCYVFYKDGTCIVAPTSEFLMYIDSVSAWSAIGFTAGKYSISNDTIIMKVLTIGSSTSTCGVRKFKILTSKRLQQFYKGSCITGEYSKKHATIEAKFVPYDISPINDEVWIKKKRWFWCDKEEYKAWKKRRKK